MAGSKMRVKFEEKFRYFMSGKRNDNSFNLNVDDHILIMNKIKREETLRKTNYKFLKRCDYFTINLLFTF